VPPYPIVAIRVDIGTLRPPVKLPDGRLRADAYLTRTGIFVYRNADGSERREYRPPEEVFDAASLESFVLAPVTDNHPEELISATNARKYAVGAVGENIRKDGDFVAATLSVIDATTIAKMEQGKVQISCGYECELDHTPGEINGQRYDAIQRNIRGNHVAIVDTGRAGPGVRVRMDGAAEMVVTATHGDTNMDELKKALAQIAELTVARDMEKARADTAETKVAELEGKLDAEKARADAAEKARTDAAEALAGQIQARVDLQTAALKVLGDDLALGKMTDREIKVAVVKKVDGAEIADDKADAYVDARFDVAIERAAKADESLAETRKTAETATKSDNEDATEKARADMIAAQRNAWRADA